MYLIDWVALIEIAVLCYSHSLNLALKTLKIVFFIRNFQPGEIMFSAIFIEGSIVFNLLCYQTNSPH